jgi:hypothetical protein
MMSDGFATADPAVWASAHWKYLCARTAFQTLQISPERPDEEATGQEMKVAENELLDLNAPNLVAVIEKLNILWGDDLFASSADAVRMCRIIGDLRRLNNERS